MTSRPSPAWPNAAGLVQGEVNQVEPGKRPLSSMTPTIVHARRQAVPADRQPRRRNHHLDHAGKHPQRGGLRHERAAGRERAAHAPAVVSAEVWIEDGMLSSESPEAQKMGYRFRTIHAMGADEAILIDPKTGVLEGANDPRRPAGLAGGLLISRVR